jgi:hypothetical protein
MMKQCGLTVASRSDSGVISSSVSESALSASDTAAPNSANYKKLVLQTEFEVCKEKRNKKEISISTYNQIQKGQTPGKILKLFSEPMFDSSYPRYHQKKLRVIKRLMTPRIR